MRNTPHYLANAADMDQKFYYKVMSSASRCKKQKKVAKESTRKLFFFFIQPLICEDCQETTLRSHNASRAVLKPLFIYFLVTLNIILLELSIRKWYTVAMKVQGGEKKKTNYYLQSL